MLAMALIIGGCGAGGGESSLTKAEFVKQANAACHRKRASLLERISAYLSMHHSEGESSSRQTARMIKAVVLPTIRNETNGIEALGAPPGDEKRVDGFVAAQRTAIRQVAKLDEIPSMERFEAHFNKASDQMRAYGLGSCANSAKPVDRKLPGWQSQFKKQP